MDEKIIEAFKEVLEQRDALSKALDFKSTQVETLEKNKNKSESYPVNSKNGFIVEVKKKQTYCLDNDIKSCVFLIKLDNYFFARDTFGAAGAEASLLDLSTQLLGVAKENDLIGYVFDYTFAMFVPFMNDEEGKVFASSLAGKLNASSHLFKNKNVPIKVRIVQKELGNEDVSKFLYNLDLFFNHRV